MSAIYQELLDAKRCGIPCAIATVTETRGSIPREAGAKMIVYSTQKISGTIGGGKFEALVIADCLAAMADGIPLAKTYPLHEKHDESFGAICGGEVSVFIEPQLPDARLIIVGGGHCAQAIAKAACDLEMEIMVVEDREDQPLIPRCLPLKNLNAFTWRATDAVVLVSRNYEIDTEALAQAMQQPLAYVGMIGSKKKVRTVLQTLHERGFSRDQLAAVYTPIGLDIGADSPAEIAIAVLAELLKVTKKGSGQHLSITQTS